MQVLSRKERRGGKGRAGVGEGKRGRCHSPPHTPPYPIRERTTAAGQRKDGGWDKRERRGDRDAGVGWREDERQKMLQVAADGGRCEVAETTESTIT